MTETKKPHEHEWRPSLAGLDDERGWFLVWYYCRNGECETTEIRAIEVEEL